MILLIFIVQVMWINAASVKAKYLKFPFKMADDAAGMDVDEEENDVAGEEYLDNSMSISMNRSELSRIISVDVGTQIKNN